MSIFFLSFERMKQYLIVISLLFYAALIGCQNGSEKQAEQSLPEKLVDRIQLVDLDGVKGIIGGACSAATIPVATISEQKEFILMIRQRIILL